MRGEVLLYDVGAGTGLISGDDGVRYQFSSANLRDPRPLGRGLRVDFVVRDGAAADVFVLQAQPFGSDEPLQSSGEDLDIWGYFAKAMRMSFNGEGRARRKEYWSFVLFSWLFLVGGMVFLFGLSAAYNYSVGYDPSSAPTDAMAALTGIGVLLILLVFTPASITVMIRRLHDLGMSGWLYLIVLFPYLGGLFLFICSLLPSERRVNKHGAYPKPTTS